jgi:hypothetical protein
MIENKAEYRKAWRLANPERAAAHGKRWYDANAETKRAARKRYYYENGGHKPPTDLAEIEARAASTRRHIAKKKGFAECTEYPPRPADGRCAICTRVRKLVLDHDHTTGAFRGYICRDCNMAMGKLGDSIDGLRRALAYLERLK